jgi:hypothetical protein
VGRIDEHGSVLSEMPEFGESGSFDILRPGDGNSQVLSDLPIGPGRLFGEPVAVDNDELFARSQILQGGENVAAEGLDDLEGTRIQEGTFQVFTSMIKKTPFPLSMFSRLPARKIENRFDGYLGWKYNFDLI